MTAAALGRFKDLCIDAADPAGLGAFWGGVLGLDVVTLPDGDVRLDGPTPQHTVWVNRVPEPRTVKQRVHLDVHAAGVAEVLARGATAVDLDTFRWAVLADPEGGEFCAFTRAEPPSYRLYEVVVDCVDPVASARWWARLLGATVHLEDDDGAWAWIDDIAGAPFESLVFVPVPEPKTAKNRIHLDLTAPALGPVLDVGAVVLAASADDRPWHVLADPEGNEFCVFVDGDCDGEG